MLNDALPSSTRPKLPHYNMAALSHCQCSPESMVFFLRDRCIQHEEACQNLLSRTTSYLPGWSRAVGINTGHMLAKRKEKSTPFGKHDGSVLRRQPGVIWQCLALTAISDSGREVLLAMWPMMVEVVRGSVLVSRLKPRASCSRHHRSVRMAQTT